MGSIWYNYWNPPYTSDLPNYFNEQNYGWAAYLKDDFNQLKKDLLKIVNERNGQLNGYFSEDVSNDASKWHTLAFKTWGIEVKANLRKSETIQSLLAKYPEIVSCSVNILNPGAEIKEHQGDTDGIVRVHFGIEIPEGDLAFCVNDESKKWQEGEFIIFLDANRHKAWNNTGSRRVIFLFDVIREEYKSHRRRICINVRSFLLLQYTVSIFKWFKKWPKWIHKMIFFKWKLFLWSVYPIQKVTGTIIKHT